MYVNNVVKRLVIFKNMKEFTMERNPITKKCSEALGILEILKIMKEFSLERNHLHVNNVVNPTQTP